jgi:peptidoglycan/LPS O-acetylase OafA/YrhL
MTQNIDSNHTHLYKMDVLRGLAIISVFILHVYMGYFGSAIEVLLENGENFVNLSGKPWLLILLTITPLGYGWTGVQLFLIISGFLIHLSYLRTKDQSFSFKKFYLRRFFRIYPPYLLLLLFLAFEYNRNVLQTKEGLFDLIAHIFMAHNLKDSTFLSFNGPFWSLALEVQLYLIYPLFLFIRKRVGIQKTIYVLFFLYFFFTFYLYFRPITGYFLASQNFVFKSWIVWGLGAFLAERYHNKQTLFNVSGKVLIILLMLASLVKMSIFTIKISDLVWSMFYIAMVNYYLNFKRNKPALWEKGLMDIGELSYSFYLIHEPMLSVFIHTISILGISLAHPMFRVLDSFVIFIIIYIFSKGYYHSVEKPSIQLGKWIIAQQGKKNA